MRITLRRSVILCLLLLLSTLLLSEQPTVNNNISVLVTDRTPLPLSNHFGPPGIPQITDRGDVFLNMPTALFHWDSTSGMTRLLQGSDPHPGYPGSVNDLVGQNLVVNSLGHAAMINYFAQKAVKGPRGIFVYDGTAYKNVAMRSDTAPDTGGKTFQGFGQLRINNNDQVAFLADLDPIPGGGRGIYVGSTTALPVKIAATGDEAPDGYGYYGSLNLIGFNDQGEVAFWADFYPPRPRAVFIASLNTGTVTKVVASGDSAAGTGGTFNLLGAGNYLLNNLGEIAFVSNVNGAAPTNRGIWICNSAGIEGLIVKNTDSFMSWQIGGSLSMYGFNTSGRVLFGSTVQIPDTNQSGNNALFLKRLNTDLEVIFKASDAIPGGRTSEKFGNVAQALLNEDGDVAFLSNLMFGSIAYGWFFLGSSDTASTPVALEGQPTPAGGTYGLADGIGTGMLNAAGQLSFIAELFGPNDFGVFRWTPGDDMEKVMTTADQLPAGANTILRTFVPAGNNDTLIFGAWKAGGRATMFARPLPPAKEEYIPIVTEGDVAPGGNGRFWYGIGNYFPINDSGEVSYYSVVVGGNSASGIYTWKRDAGAELRKVVRSAELAPGAREGRFVSINRNNRPPIKINKNGQIAFMGYTDADPGIFLGSANSQPIAIARMGDLSPTDWGTFVNFSQAPTLNDSGQVAFRATWPVPGAQNSGIFVGDGTTVAKVVASGDMIAVASSPYQRTVGSAAGTFLINNLGQVAYVANFTGQPQTQAVVLGTPGGVQVPIAATFDASPIAGYTFSGFRESDIQLNNNGDVAFWAQIADGVNFKTGCFLKPANGPLVARLVDGDPLPGGGTLAVAPVGINNIPGENMTLDDNGQMRIFVHNISGSPNWNRQLIITPQGELRKLFAMNEIVPGTGAYIGAIFQMVGENSRGEYFDTVMLVEGQAKWAIIWNVPSRK